MKGTWSEVAFPSMVTHGWRGLWSSHRCKSYKGEDGGLQEPLGGALLVEGNDTTAETWETTRAWRWEQAQEWVQRPVRTVREWKENQAGWRQEVRGRDRRWVYRYRCGPGFITRAMSRVLVRKMTDLWFKGGSCGVSQGKHDLTSSL